MSPGLNKKRMLNLMRAAVERCRLDLRDSVVLTEAASGAYVVTPILAAMAGARRVFAMTRPTRYGSVEEVTAGTTELARAAECDDRIEIITELTPQIIGQADIVTNSGHVRPIDARFISRMKPGAVIPLMYEAWEYRTDDLDLSGCRERGITVGGTNERIPQVDVFSYLGVMAVKLLLDAGVSVYGSHLLVLCDNPFAPYIERGLLGAGATVQMARDLGTAITDRAPVDAILVAMHPRKEPVIAAADAAAIAARWPGAVLAQYWGDVDRDALVVAGVVCWPERAPHAGHMAILPSGVGPESIVRLQSGGLKVGEVLLRAARSGDRTGWEFVDEL
ncbi:MAG TPA: hypothetical protein VH475_07210 [Tepidisphaeraceae bacterium]|jgi:hypothetical protein